MSVRSDKRNESSLEFLNTAHELEKLTMTLTLRESAIPKRYRYILGQPLCESARLINKYIVYANSIFPKTQEEYEMRKRYQKQARIELFNYSELMRLATELLPIKGGVIEEWTTLERREEIVLKRWMESDRQRFKDL